MIVLRYATPVAESYRIALRTTYDDLCLENVTRELPLESRMLFIQSHSFDENNHEKSKSDKT